MTANVDVLIKTNGTQGSKYEKLTSQSVQRSATYIYFSEPFHVWDSVLRVHDNGENGKKSYYGNVWRAFALYYQEEETKKWIFEQGEAKLSILDGEE